MDKHSLDLYQSEGEMSHSASNYSADGQNRTGPKLAQFLKDLELEQHYLEKMSMSTLLQIDSKAITDETVKSKTDVVWYFLKKLMMANVTARNVKCESISDPDSSGSSKVLNLDTLLGLSSTSDMLNPLDIITALFLCSDGFVQQELALKMSMCQFAVPLLLPNCDTERCTLMLWAMRDIVKKYRPQSLSESKGFKEESIVLSEIPMVSFVRLGECSLSKSEILNKLLSNSQQYHDTFVHRDMECGDCARNISNGLTEITWYLPSGTNIDIFSEPVAVANLHGDIASFETQYSFLCQTSSAVFVFFDDFKLDFRLLANINQKEKIYLVVDQRNQHFNSNSLKMVASRLGLTNSRILIKTKARNDADFVKSLREMVSNVAVNTTTKMPLVKMADVALDLGICVDEYNQDCQKAKENANAITKKIHDILCYKETQLPLQGQIWKELTSLEKEEFRLRKVGSEGLEKYKCKLQAQRKQLRAKQNSHEMSNAMISFITSLISEKERRYFLKWMRINLDNLSREKLSGLRELYKNKCNDSRNKEEIKEIDRQLSCSSLGTEHFFREMGQIYEASVSLPKTHHSRQQLQHLPRLCAQLMLDGFPLELVDGDASNIPLRWVSDVLAQLHELVSPKNKILVVTVLGVQSTGKSTLLNTMFGVQFAVSSGRCTRGAFMLLIRVSEDLKQTLNCDFLVIIDTEGLKSPELAQLDDSYEHDNELATLVVGLSDITLINIAMENAVEMKDILQIVVHAFLRMKEVGKKPKCQFVHQNVSDVSAHENNLRDRNLLLQQLDEMTQAAAKMEKKDKYKSFKDVMEYKPDTGNCYIPGLWNGNPPMALVNAGYSEAVYDLKKNILGILGKCESSAKNILEFQGWMTSLWKAVKHENFIFSFRNSLVADAYMMLCTEFNKWGWDFKKAMYKWFTDNETRIKNFGTAAKERFSDIQELLTRLKTDACIELSKWEKILLDNLTEYFKLKKGHVYLVEGYKQEFENSARSLRRDIESSVMNQLTAAAEIKQGLTEVDRIKKKHVEKIEARVCKLIDNCRMKHAKMTDQELDREFDNMWTKTVDELDRNEQKVQNVFVNVNYHLTKNLQDKGSHACEALNNKKLENCGTVPYKYTPDGLVKQLKYGMCRILRIEDHVKEAQYLADRIITACEQIMTKKERKGNNYHETYILEILQIIDAGLNSKDMNSDIAFEVSLKQHICAVAARRFQKMHEDFLSANDPYRCLNKNKEKFRADFKDLFYERDQCQKKAEEFTNQCLRPAVKDFIERSLGSDIIGEMHTCQEFRTRIFFQYTLLLDLLKKDKFSEYLKYIRSYESYVKEWILDRILGHFSNSSAISEFENKHVQSCICSINEAIISAKNGRSATMEDFIEQIFLELDGKLHISPDALSAFMILNNANLEQFAYWLTKCVNEMAQSFQKSPEITGTQIIPSFHMDAQNELFKEMEGCGKQCPFCKVPCDAGGGGHSVHWASLHRSRALGGRTWIESNQLVTDICSTAVGSETRFRNSATEGEWHPYKNYSDIYKDWKIDADVSLEASDYWKYVLNKFNKDFAKAFNAEPADIPEKWGRITLKQAEKSIKVSFSMK